MCTHESLFYLQEFFQIYLTFSGNGINDDLKKIEAWYHQWKMSFKPDPLNQAQEVIFSKKRKEKQSSKYHFERKSSKNKAFTKKHLEIFFSPIQDGPFRDCSRMGEAFCNTYSTMTKLGTVICYLKKIQKMYESRDTSLQLC